MPPPKKPKTKESWDEFISESQAESFVDKHEDSLGSPKTGNQLNNCSDGIEGKKPVDCSDRFTKPEPLEALIPEDLSKKPDRNGCLGTPPNTIQEVLKQTIIANESTRIQDSSSGAEHHPQLRNILLIASSSDPILTDVGENLVSSGVGLQEMQVTRKHSGLSVSANTSKILWKNPSVHASANELQPLTAFYTYLPSGGNDSDEVILLDSSGRDREQNPSGRQIKKQEESCAVRLVKRDQQNLSSCNTITVTCPQVNRDGGYSNDNLEKLLTQRYSTSQANGPSSDQDGRTGLGVQVPTADSTTHVVVNSNQLKRLRVNGERVQARHQVFQEQRGQNTATQRRLQEPHARGPTSIDRICQGQSNLEHQRPRNPSPETSSSDTQSHSHETLARLFTQLHRKDIPVVEYLVSSQQPQSGDAARILSKILPRALQNVPGIQRSPQTSPNGKPQSEGGHGEREVEKGLVIIANKLIPTSALPLFDSKRKMATLRELLCDDSALLVTSAYAKRSVEVKDVNIADSGAAHRLQESNDVGRMEDNRPWSAGSHPEDSLENENSCEIPTQMMSTDVVHSSPEMPSSSCNERGRNKAEEKGVCRCQICDDVASGFHYGVWSCEGCKAFFKRSLHGVCRCQICDDVASGFHYGVWSCEGCKAFFKRSLHGPVDYVCPATNNCTIDKLRRKSCQACRLRKCHEAGMTAGMSRKEKGIRPTGKKRKAGEEELCTSDADVAASSTCFGKSPRYDSVGSSRDADLKRNQLSPYREMKHSPSSAANPPIVGRDSPQPNLLVDRLLAIELPVREAEFNSCVTNSGVNLMSGLLGLINSQLVDIITWSKSIPDFSKSSLESRTRLLVASWSELLILGTVWQSVSQPNTWVCAPNLLLSRAHCKVAMIETMFDRIMLLVQTFRRLQLTKTELVLLRLTILLNSDSSVIETQPPLANLRNLLDETWQQLPPPDDAALQTSRNRLSHLLLALPDLRQCSLMMHDVINDARRRQEVPTYNLLHEMLDCDVLRMSEMRASSVSAAGVD